MYWVKFDQDRHLIPKVASGYRSRLVVPKERKDSHPYNLLQFRVEAYGKVALLTSCINLLSARSRTEIR